MNLPNLVPKSNCRVVKFSFYSHSKFTHGHPTHFSFCLRDGEFYFIICCLLLRDTHATSKKRVQFSRFSTPLVQLCPTFFHPLDLGRPISNDPPSPPPSPLQMTTNQLKEDITQGQLLYGLSLRSAFDFSINSLILSGFPLASFHLAEAKLVTRTILKN